MLKPYSTRATPAVQEHHEVGENRHAIDAAAADLAHQVHAHGIAAERKEGAVAEA